MEKHFGLRIDEELLRKFRFVCEYEGRSANRQILQLIIKFVADYEAKQGKIELDDEENTKL